MSGSLTVTVRSAANLPNLERFGKSDPLCVVSFQGVKNQTKEKKGDLNPVWDEQFSWPLQNPLRTDDRVQVQVFDWERAGSNKLMGQTEISLRDLISSGGMECEETLKNGQGEQINGTITLTMSYQAPPSASSGGGGGDGDGGGDGFQDETDAGGGGGEEGGGDGGGDDDDDPAPTADEAPGGPASAPSVVIGGGAGGKAARRAMLRRRKANRANLPKKPCDFQVRVHIITARKLVGQNINPVVNIRVFDQVQPTMVKKGTNKPYFDQMFYFSFHMAPREFLEKVITIEVMNSRTLRADSLIGSFQFDTGLCYDFENHSIIQKWLLLTNPQDPSGGAKGYLKISASVYGPNDEVKRYPKAVQDDTCDIESNLLRPAGVELTPCTFTVRLYRAEDVPQMDTALLEGLKKAIGVGSKKRKELVDPYVVMNFAGHKSKTNVLYNNENPEWEEELQVGCKFPSMCDRIRLRMMDKDNFNPDDTVGTCYLNLSEISAPGETGFLPTFGPAWVNIYGSPREYSDLPDEYDYLNMGILEGICYRARMLVEVSTELNKYPETTVAQPIAREDTTRVNQYFLRRRNFTLRAAFMNATMLPEAVSDSPVSFEVSMGNYGNQLDPNLPPCSSTTQPTNPVSDGEHYNYLPWADTKPCVSVDCQWEDIHYRLDALNILLSICDRLQANIRLVHHMKEAEAPAAETARAFIDLIDLLRKDLGDPRRQLPSLPNLQTVTTLDQHMHSLRTQELNTIRSEADNLRQSATDIDEALNEVESYLNRLQNLAFEAQNSMPDVIIWMLTNKKRLAYARIPAHEVLYAHHADGSKWSEACGKNCGKPQTIYLNWPPKKDSVSPKAELPAVLRMVLWLGLEVHTQDWLKCADEGEVSVFAETYENNAHLLGWGKTGLTRPAWSDVQGKMVLNKEHFEPPPEGWMWQGDWFINPELSLSFGKDTGKAEFVEDIYEYESRIPGTSWSSSAKKTWGNVRGDEMPSRDEVEVSKGWVWKDTQWTVDLNRACDEQGFEYTLDPSLAGYVPVERNYHMCRRRRWIRRRMRDKSTKDARKQDRTRAQLEEKAKDGWEYSRLFSTKFHLKEQKIDLARRRRWHRKLTATGGAHAPVFTFKDEDGDPHQVTPRMFMTFKDVHRYQLRVYLYQARNVRSSDQSGLSDPYCFVSFLRDTEKSIMLEQTIMPTWDQTIVMDDIEIYGDPRVIATVPPDVIVELYDHDKIGKDEFLGRAVVKPHIRLDSRKPPRLDWYPIKYFGKDAGELLAAFHLMLSEGDELPFAPERKEPPYDSLYRVPTGIRPEMQLMKVEALCWGVRDLKRCQLLSVDRPHVTITVGGIQMKTVPIKKIKKSPNYENPLIIFERVELPKEELYMPPLDISVFDNRAFGRTPLVGTHSVIHMREYKRDDKRFLADPPASQEVPAGAGDVALADQPSTSVELNLDDVPLVQDGSKALSETEEEPKKEIDQEERKAKFVDWWSKYYASTEEADERARDYNEKYHDMIEVLDEPLEKFFGGFNDFVDTFPIYSGKGQRDNEDGDNQAVGNFKGVFCIYPLPEDGTDNLPLILQHVPSSKPQKCIVRIYVIKCEDLQSQDPNGKNDPYLRVYLGKERVVNDKENYIPNTLDPVFGKMFEINATLPIEHQLKVQVMDWDLLSADDLIGQTVIDLEDRYLTKFRATCGLPKSYCIDGTNLWRDCQRPTDILESVCKRRGLPAPVYHDSRRCQVAGQQYFLTPDDDLFAPQEELGPAKERIALKVLNHFDLVPEHLELRPLYNPLRPGLECGKMQMWIDIFPEENGYPGSPINVSPRKPDEYELRVIVWNVEEVPLDEAATLTGEMMSDIYLKGWLRDSAGKKHKTDVHYRSLDGEGNFNWRWIMPFQYIPAEKMMVIKKKEHFYSLDKTEIRRPPVLQLQVWDNDLFSLDDYLGSVEFSLCSMPPPAKKSSKCAQDQFGDPTTGRKPRSEYVSLFDSKRLRGWWPMRDINQDGEVIHAGKVELELEILTKAESEEKPAGEARDDPNANPVLDPPNRPETSFLWFTSPWKTFKFIIWKHWKWYIIGALVLIILGLLIALFIYSAPGYAVMKIFGFK